MKQGIKGVRNYRQDQPRVIQNLQWTDVLLVFLPMTLIVMSIGIIPAANTSMRDPGGIILAFTGLAVSFVFAVVYEFLAFILSLVMRRNVFFRIALIFLLALGAWVSVQLFG